MKKRWISLLMASVMGLSAFAAAACGDNGGNNEQPPSGQMPSETPPDNPEEPATPDREAPAYSDAENTLSLRGKVDPDDPEKTISPELFGLFLEDINYASYALDDNLVVNGSFEKEESVSAPLWTGNGATITRKTGEDSLSAAAPTYAEVNVSQAGGSISNSGYKYVPMYIRTNVNYVFSAFIKGYGGDITVSAKTNQKTLAEGTFTVTQSDEWVKYEKVVTATATDDKNISLEIKFGTADSSVLLDGVKFETTDSTIGFKNYMYEPIRDLSPAFFRFPGGCVIEGTNMQEAYDWKNSIGAVVEGEKDVVPQLSYLLVKSDGTREQVTTRGEQVTRKPNTDIWQGGGEYYEMEYGIGFYEYFLLCDNLGASAIPIVNCGYSCQTQTHGSDSSIPVNTGRELAGRHGKKVNDYIQDAIDLMCFAKGSTTSSDENEAYWAQVRTDMGHAEPFEMHYIGIGNEQWDKYYTQYYEKFLADEAFQAALAKFEVKPIVGNCTMYTHCEDPENQRQGVAQSAADYARSHHLIEKISDYGIVDQHYYMNYTDFLEAADLYDSYKRPSSAPNDYYDVFVGEYSANSRFTRSEIGKFSAFDYVQNSWLTAISEAAYMTGLERNGDIVKLAAYAPMFGVKTDETYVNQWAVDMMFFTNNRLTRTPNYYVQQLFMQNAGDYKVTGRMSGTLPETVYNGFVASNSNGEVATSTPTTRTFGDIYYVTSRDKETGDLIVKLVNVGAKAFKLNIEFLMTDCQLTGMADVIELANDDVNATHETRETIKPKSYTIGGFTDGTKLGYTAAAHSVNVIRLHTK